MAAPPVQDGWTRFILKSKFGMGRDFRVLDPQTEEQRYYVDGKVGARPKAEIQDARGATVFTVRGSFMGLFKTMTIADAAGTELASLKAKKFSMIKDRMTLTVPSGEPWELSGTFMEKNYTVRRAGQPVVEISQKWVTLRDSYTLDVADGTDAGLALAIVWAVDRWVERD